MGKVAEQFLILLNIDRVFTTESQIELDCDNILPGKRRRNASSQEMGWLRTLILLQPGLAEPIGSKR